MKIGLQQNILQQYLDTRLTRFSSPSALALAKLSSCLAIWTRTKAENSTRMIRTTQIRPLLSLLGPVASKGVLFFLVDVYDLYVHHASPCFLADDLGHLDARF